MDTTLADANSRRKRELKPLLKLEKASNLEDAQAHMSLASIIDHTLLKPDASEQAIKKLCQEAKEYGFYSVCIHSFHVPLVKRELSNSAVRVCSVIGFPLGQTTMDQKISEARSLVEMGVQEIDMVMNLSALKDQNDIYVVEEIERIKQAIGSVSLKVIIETGLLSFEQKVRACEAVVKAGAQFVKTCTGFAEGAATVEDIQLILENVGSLFGIKASGGIKTLAQAKALVAAGATRLGCSSSVQIIQEEKSTT